MTTYTKMIFNSFAKFLLFNGDTDETSWNWSEFEPKASSQIFKKFHLRLVMKAAAKSINVLHNSSVNCLWKILNSSNRVLN